MTAYFREKLKSTGTVVGIIGGLIAILATVVGAFTQRIDKVDLRVDGVESELRQHKDNSAIHRTAEEGRAFERGEQAKWELLMDRLQSIDKRLEKLEARP